MQWSTQTPLKATKFRKLISKSIVQVRYQRPSLGAGKSGKKNTHHLSIHPLFRVTLFLYAMHIRVQVIDMKEMLLHKRIGLFHVDVTQFQKDCLPFPEKVLEAVGRHLPVIAAKRNDVLLNVIKVSTCLTSSFWFFSALTPRFFVAVFSAVSCHNCNNYCYS